MISKGRGNVQSRVTTKRRVKESKKRRTDDKGVSKVRQKGKKGAQK